MNALAELPKAPISVMTSVRVLVHRRPVAGLLALGLSLGYVVGLAHPSLPGRLAFFSVWQASNFWGVLTHVAPTADMFHFMSSAVPAILLAWALEPALGSKRLLALLAAGAFFECFVHSLLPLPSVGLAGPSGLTGLMAAFMAAWQLDRGPRLVGAALGCFLTVVVVVSAVMMGQGREGMHVAHHVHLVQVLAGLGAYALARGTVRARPPALPASGLAAYVGVMFFLAIAPVVAKQGGSGLLELLIATGLSGFAGFRLTRNPGWLLLNGGLLAALLAVGLASRFAPFLELLALAGFLVPFLATDAALLAMRASTADRAECAN